MKLNQNFEPLISDLTKVIAIGGKSDSIALYEVEVVDLLNPGNKCGFLADYPAAVAHHTATYMDEVVKSCGGIYYDESIELGRPYEYCYDYEPTSNMWIQSAGLLKPRMYMASSLVGNNWLISGGKLINYLYVNETLSWDDVYLNDTEIFIEGASSFELGSAILPETMINHCQATINDTHVFFVEDRHAYILDYANNIWIQVEDITVDINTPSCGHIYNSVNGVEIVVASEGYTRIFNLSTLEWKEGPHLIPYGDHYGVAQLENTVVFAGGDPYSRTTMNNVYLFDNENYEWLLLQQTLDIPREDFAIVAVPTEFVNC